nr:RNA methyltransferase [Taibaiella soli]
MGQQKYRKEHNVYLAEGEKLAEEWLQSNAVIKMIVAEEPWIDANQALIRRHPDAELLIAKSSDLESISLLQTPNKVLLVVETPKEKAKLPQSGWCIALDTIQDPGNMGTIIRIADWFGITDIVCSHDCVEAFNPKVVQSGMGGHLRVNIHKTDLDGYLSQTKMPVFAAILEGTDVYDMPRNENGILLIGNESKGIHPQLIAKASHKVTIPRKGGAESLNAGVSAGILCALLLPR